jgi:small subunit ribosomal protein S25e
MVKRGRAGKTPSTSEESAPKTTLVTQISVTPELLKRLERDLKKGVFKVLTPYTVAQAYNIRISTAKKLLREAARKNLIVLYSGGRTPIYVKP